MSTQSVMVTQRFNSVNKNLAGKHNVQVHLSIATVPWNLTSTPRSPKSVWKCKDQWRLSSCQQRTQAQSQAPHPQPHTSTHTHTHTHTHLFTPVSFSQHDHAAPSRLELIHIGIHPARCCWTKGSTGITLVTHKTDDGAPFHWQTLKTQFV